MLRPAGRFVLCDVIVPENDVATPIPLEEGVDLPDTVHDQLRWLADVDLDASVVFVEDDVAILRAEPATVQLRRTPDCQSELGRSPRSPCPGLAAVSECCRTS